MRLNLKRSLLYLAIFIWSLYSFTIEMTARVFPVTKISIPILFFSAAFIVYYYSRQRYYLNWKNLLPLLLIIIMLCFHNQDLSNGSYSYCFLFVSLLLAFPYMSGYEDWQEAFIRIILMMSLFYAVMTYLIMIKPDLWYKIVYPNLGSGYQSATKYGLASRITAAFGFTSNAGANAMYLIPGLLVTVCRLMTEKKGGRKSWFICFIVILGALLATAKRSFIGFGLFSIVFTYFILHSAEPLKRWGKIILWGSVSAVVFVILAEYLPFLNNVFEKMTIYATAEDVSAGRDILRVAAWRFFTSNPFVGIGWGGFKYQYDSFVAVHNVYLQLMCEVGIVGCIPFFLFFWVALSDTYKAVRYYAKNRIALKGMNVLAFSFSFQVFFLTYCLTGNPLYDPPVLFPYLLSVSIGASFYQMCGKEIV